MIKSFTITITIFLGLCTLTAFSQSMQRPLDAAQFYNTFKSWLSQFNKQYGIEEMAVRYHNWKNNFDFVQEHNSKDLPFKLEMNHFADLTSEEFSALHLGYNPELGTASTQNTTDNSSNSQNETALPKSVDWRKAGAVTPVKNQSTCGSCWAFSSVGALEGLHAIKNNILANFSEQQLVDCSDDYGNAGCSGGLMTNAFNYTQDHGIQLEADYPYVGENATCNYDPKKIAFTNTGFKEVAENNSLALKAAVALQPVSVAIEASSMTIQLFKSGVITSGCSTDVDHAVVAVGYDTDANGTEYWILKNSWSYKWGLDGFFHIAMGSQNSGAGVCGINISPSYPTL